MAVDDDFDIHFEITDEFPGTYTIHSKNLIDCRLTSNSCVGSEWLASDALELPSNAIDIEPQQSNAASSTQRRNANRSINLPDRISESGYLQSSAGEDLLSDMLEGSL